MNYPGSIMVEITTYCNLECKMCPRKGLRSLASNPPGHMNEAIWKKILEIAPKLNHVSISGFGELICNPNFIHFLQDLDNLEVGMSFPTNGIKLTESISKELASIINLSRINISLDSPDPDTYRKIRGVDLNIALSGAETLLRNIHDPDRVSVSSVVMRDNLMSLETFPALLSNLGIKTLILQKMLDFNPRVEEGNIIDRIDLQRVIKNIRHNCAELNIRLEIAPMLEEDIKEGARVDNGPNHPTRQCYMPWDIPFINKDGHVFPCCFADEANRMGDLKENSFLEIWGREKFEDFRRCLLSGDNMPTICRDCRVAPLGPHPFSLYSARIILDRSKLYGDPQSIGGMRLSLAVKNTGETTWTRESRIRIGTSGGRKDCRSAYYHHSWISENRICTFAEEKVSPGVIATFNFTITPSMLAGPEIFQLVAEGKCWLPFTQFEIMAAASSL
jgi:radical SAM protein with 4Fe4S-binding SPASM domain